MEQTTQIRRSWRAGIVLVVGTLAAVAIRGFRPQERLLTTLGHPVVRVNVATTHLSWLSDRQLLILTTNKEASAGKAQPGDSTAGHWDGSADLFDADTGVSTQLPGLTDLLKRTIVFPMKEPSDFQIFPNGRWLLWENLDEEHGSPPQMAWLDGTHYRTWQHRGQEDVFFLDAQHLASIREQDPLLILYDLENPAQDRSYRNPEQATAALARHALQRPIFLNVSHPAVEGIAATVKIETYRTEDSIQGILHRSRVSAKGIVPFHTQELKLPEGTTLHWSNASPQQQSIFYLLRHRKTPPFLTWLHRLLPKFEIKSRITEELWVSRADGSGMHEIGHVPLPQRPGIDPPYVLADIHWLPDGKRISFVYQGMLYIVLAEPQK